MNKPRNGTEDKELITRSESWDTHEIKVLADKEMWETKRMMRPLGI